MSKLARRLRRWADKVDGPDAKQARSLRVPLEHLRFFARIADLTPIRTVLDIGAHTGEYARWASACFADAQVHCFEPLPACQANLARLAADNAAIRVHSVALGDQEGELTMHENDYRPSSSLLAMQDRHRQLWPKTAQDHPIKVPVHRLDRYAAEFSAPIFLKADVQGFEMHVLRGAAAVLANTAVIQLEVLFEPLYKDQTDLRALMNHLAEYDFDLMEVIDQRRLGEHGHVAYADVAFVARRFKQTRPTSAPT